MKKTSEKDKGFWAGLITGAFDDDPSGIDTYRLRHASHVSDRSWKIPADIACNSVVSKIASRRL